MSVISGSPNQAGKSNAVSAVFTVFSILAIVFAILGSKQKFYSVFAIRLVILTLFAISVIAIAKTDAWVNFTTMLVG